MAKFVALMFVPFDVSSIESVQAKRWLAPPASSPLAHALVKDHHLSLEIAELVARRIQTQSDGYSQKDNTYFLTPSLREHLPEPLTLHDMERAVSRTELAIRKKENIGIITDYDVDGTTSGTILFQYLQAIGITPVVQIPERLKEGYGPNSNTINEFGDKHHISLLFTLDCGTSSHATLGAAKKLGIDVIVIDHHQTENTALDVYALINPKKDQDQSGLTHLASVGLVFLFLVALNRVLRSHDSFREPDLLQSLDLVALGTVCDMVPLVGLNRLLVRQGLRVMRKTTNAGLRAIIKAAKLRHYPNARDLGFALGPAINAASRMGNSKLGFQLFTSQNLTEVKSIAHHLLTLNKQRQVISEQHFIAFGKPLVDGLSDKTPKQYIHIADRNVHLGVAGLLATRLAQQHHKPAFIGHIDEETRKVKGSARSVAGVDIGACLQNAKTEGILEKAGGHSMAGGFQYTLEKQEQFEAFLDRYFLLFPLTTPKDTIQIDVFLPSCSPQSVTDFSQKLSVLEPFGTGNLEPIVLFANVMCDAYPLKDKPHIVCKTSSRHAGKQHTIHIFAFQAVGTPLGDALLSPNLKGACLHVLVRMQAPSSYGGKPLLRLVDIGTASS